MKATIEFNLPEEREEYKMHMDAGAMSSALWDIAQYLRSQYKYAELPEAEAIVIDRVREEFYRIINEHNLEV